MAGLILSCGRWRRVPVMPARSCMRLIWTGPSRPSTPSRINGGRRTTATTTLSPLSPCRSSSEQRLPQLRHFHALGGMSGVMLAPLVFCGLLVGLWTWKCFMMVIFQNKIIYMPGLPPTARQEQIEDHAARCLGIAWREERIRASDGTDLALCITDAVIGGGGGDVAVDRGDDNEATPHKTYYILYFQGNASSIPPRLPDISSALAVLRRRAQNELASIRYVVAGLSYRGYWSSRGRPTEKGIRLDALAALDWVSRQQEHQHQHQVPPAEVILWGQSIGSGVATNLAADFLTTRNRDGRIHLDSLILETPFTSIRDMLEVLYPQRWLPYRYLWPFLRNHLDSWSNLGIIAAATNTAAIESSSSSSSSAADKGTPLSPLPSPPSILLLEAAKDELVPRELGDRLHARCLDLFSSSPTPSATTAASSSASSSLPLAGGTAVVQRVAVPGAFHNDAMFRSEGRRAVGEFLAARMFVGRQSR